MRAAWLICLKDLRARLRDRSAVLIGIVVPLGLAVIFNSIFSGISGASDVISLGVVSADHGAVSQQFTSQVLPAVGRSGLIAIHTEPTLAQARALAAKGTLAAVIVIPAGFSARVQANQPASMQVIGNVDAPISTQVARSIAESFAADLNRIRLSVATVAAGNPGAPLPPAQIQALAARAAAVAAPVAVSDVSAQTKELDQKSFFAAGMAVFFLFFTVQFGVTSLLEERNDGTLARLLAAPISRNSILGGKLLTSFAARRHQHDRAGGGHHPAVRSVLGEPARRRGAGRGRDPGGHRDHGPDRHPGQERGAGRQLAVGGGGRPGPGRRHVLPGLPGARRAVPAHLRRAPGVVPARARRPAGRQPLGGVDTGAGHARIRRGDRGPGHDAAQAHGGGYRT